MQIICEECGWIGNPNQLPRVGMYPAQVKYECPECGADLGSAEILPDEAPIKPSELIV